MSSRACDECEGQVAGHVRAHSGWNLGDDCTGKFKPGDKARTRGDFGGFPVVIHKVHNGHFCAASRFWWSRPRHFNMNVLEKR